jgi:hypothetical protein
MRAPVGTGAAQVASELRGVGRGAVRRGPGPAPGIALETAPEVRAERGREIRRRVRHAAAALAQQGRRLHSHAVAVEPGRGFRARHERGDKGALARVEFGTRGGTRPLARMLLRLASSGCH